MASPCKRARYEVNDIFLDEILVKIIQNVPIAQWSGLELVSKQFERCVQRANFALTALNLENVFLAQFGHYESKSPGRLQKFLTKLIRCCPRLHTISGFYRASNIITFRHLELLRNFAELKNISFEGCILNIGEFSRFLKNFPDLNSLDICECEFSKDLFRTILIDDPIWNIDAYFDFFENIHGLTRLVLFRFFEFSGSFLPMINAEHLKMLDFGRSKFDGAYVVALLKRCVNLEILNLFDPKTSVEHNSVGLELEVLQCLPNLPQLRSFHLEVAREFDDDIEYTSQNLLNVLVNCTSLRDFGLHYYLGRELISDGFLQRLIIGCPLLEALTVNTISFLSKDISKIVDLYNLTFLSIEHFGNTVRLNELFNKLHMLSNLSILKIDSNDVDENGLLLLTTVKNLTSFIYTGRHVTLRVARSWIKAGFFEKLTNLYLSSAITHSVAMAICENVPVLEDFYFKSEIYDETLRSIAENCKRLKIVSMEECKFFGTEKGLLAFMAHCRNLTVLFLSYSFTYSVLRNGLFLQYKHIIHLKH